MIKEYNKNNKNTKEEKEDREDGKKLNSSEHTLFKKHIPEKRINVKKDLFKEKPSYTKYSMFINEFMEWGRGLHEIYHELWNAGRNDKLELRIHSRGGFVDEGAQFYSIIKNKFNGRTTTILDNEGYSMGAIIFCCGDKRVITERADLMFHDYSGGIYGKGGEIEANQEHNKIHVRKFFEDVIVKQGFLSKKEYKKMLIGQDYWMGAEELCRRGIATHVLVNGKEIKAKKYLKMIKGK